MTAEITEEPVQHVQEPEAPPADEAPYGWMTDPGTGERRPKKRPGRRSKTTAPPTGTSPSLEALQALGTLSEAPDDTAPGTPPKGRKRKPAPKAESLPPFRAGPIAKWVNLQYRRIGRVVRMMDPDIGSAIIACTKRPPGEDEDEESGLTVGDAWENLAKNNPRVRRFILKCMTGGALGEVFWAHAPIFLALAMKESIRRRLPILGLLEAMVDDGPSGVEDTEDGYDYTGGMGGLFAGLKPEDMAQMMQMGQMVMGQMAAGVPRPASSPRDPVASHPDDLNGRQHPTDQG